MCWALLNRQRISVGAVLIALSVFGASMSRAAGPCGVPDFCLFADEDIGIVGLTAGVGDLDGDGIPDIVIAGSAQMLVRLGHLSSSGVLSYTNSDLLSLGGPNGGGPSNPANMLIADVNADGILDILVACQTGDGSVLVFQGTGSNGKGDGHFLPPIGVGAGGVREFELRDVNADGALDIIFANNSGGLYVYRGLLSDGHPTGQFTFHSGVSAAPFPGGFAMADFDQDGALDAIVAAGTHLDVHAGLTTGGVPNGRFGPAIPVPHTGAASDVVCMDLNGDLDPDLVVSTEDSFDKILLGGASGLTFTPLGTMAEGYSTDALEVADLDLDQRQDFVMTSNSGESFLAFNSRSGGWPLGFTLQGLTGTMRNQSFALADLNLDGGPDVVVPAAFSGHFQIFLNGVAAMPYSLSILIEGDGTAAAAPFRTRYATGMPVTLTGTPGPRQRFDHWSGSISSTSNPLEIVMTQSHAVTAHFVPDMKTLSISTEGLGTTLIDPPGDSQLVGTAISAYASPSTGYEFVGWSGDVVSDSALIHFQLDRPMALTAHFQPDGTTGVGQVGFALALAPVQPNPVNGDARLRFTLPQNGRVVLEVLDAGGRVVRTVLEAELTAGQHEAHWDGRRASGGGMAPGLYWLRLRTPAGQLTQRFTLLH
jgi:hypothetical protein